MVLQGVMLQGVEGLVLEGVVLQGVEGLEGVEAELPAPLQRGAVPQALFWPPREAAGAEGARDVSGGVVAVVTVRLGRPAGLNAAAGFFAAA